MWTVGQWEISLGFPFLSRASHTMAGGVKPELRKPACRRNHGCVRRLFNFLFGSYSTLRILLSPLSRKPHKPHNHEILYMISGDLGSLWHCFIWPNYLLTHNFVGQQSGLGFCQWFFCWCHAYATVIYLVTGLGLRWLLDLVLAVGGAKCVYLEHSGSNIIERRFLLVTSCWSEHVKQLSPDCRNSAPLLFLF